MDGSKIKANASNHKAMSYGRMVKAEPELATEVADWLRAAIYGRVSTRNGHLDAEPQMLAPRQVAERAAWRGLVHFSCPSARNRAPERLACHRLRRSAPAR